MDTERFDQLARRMAGTASRRTLLGLVGGLGVRRYPASERRRRGTSASRKQRSPRASAERRPRPRDRYERRDGRRICNPSWIPSPPPGPGFRDGTCGLPGDNCRPPPSRLCPEELLSCARSGARAALRADGKRRSNVTGGACPDSNPTQSVCPTERRRTRQGLGMRRVQAPERRRVAAASAAIPIYLLPAVAELFPMVCAAALPAARASDANRASRMSGHGTPSSERANVLMLLVKAAAIRMETRLAATTAPESVPVPCRSTILAQSQHSPDEEDWRGWSQLRERRARPAHRSREGPAGGSWRRPKRRRNSMNGTMGGSLGVGRG